MAIAVGAVAASLFSGTPFTRHSRPGLVMLGSSATCGAALTLFGMSPNPSGALAFRLMAAAADTLSVISRSTVIQRPRLTSYLAASAQRNTSSGKLGPTAHSPGPVSEAARTRSRKQQEDLVRVRAERDDLRAQAQIENHRLQESNATLEQQLAARAGVPDLAIRRPPP